MQKSLAFQPSQPFPGILDLNDTRVSILPEIEEFIVLLYGFGCVAILRFFKYLLPNFNLT
jgi:hypothetical protein